ICALPLRWAMVGLSVALAFWSTQAIQGLVFELWRYREASVSSRDQPALGAPAGQGTVVITHPANKTETDPVEQVPQPKDVALIEAIEGKWIVVEGGSSETRRAPFIIKKNQSYPSNYDIAIPSVGWADIRPETDPYRPGSNVRISRPGSECHYYIKLLNEN